MKTVTYEGSFVTLEACPPAQLPEYGFIGRSNVGKSSLINMITGLRSLAYVSKTPGKTQTLNYYKVDNAWWLVDLPGYGFAKTSRTNREAWGTMIETYFLDRPTMQCAFLLIDALVPPQKIDLAFVEFLGESGIPFAIAFTKTDRRKKGVDLNENIAAFKHELSERFTELPTTFLTSAERSVGRDEILAFIADVNKRLV